MSSNIKIHVPNKYTQIWGTVTQLQTKIPKKHSLRK